MDTFIHIRTTTELKRDLKLVAVMKKLTLTQLMHQAIMTYLQLELQKKGASA